MKFALHNLNLKTIITFVGVFFFFQATAASLNDASFITKIGFNVILRNSLDSLFINITIYQYLWDYKSDLIQTVKQFAPFMVPTENSGALFQVR